jgi:hypothetical protein
LCQRYYWTIPSYYIAGGAYGNSGNVFPYPFKLPVTMRTSPSVSFGTASLTNCSWAFAGSSTDHFSVNITVTANGAYVFGNSTNGYASAEL